MKDIRILVIIFSCPLLMFAQTDSSFLRTAGVRVLKKLGKAALRQNDPVTASVYLRAAENRKPDDASVSSLLGKAYMQQRDYESAKRSFLRAYTLDAHEAPEAIFYHGMMQKSVGQYDSARIAFSIFSKKYKGSRKDLKRQARREVIFCDSVNKLLADVQRIKIIHLDSSINKKNTEGSPLQISDRLLLFSSLRTEQQVTETGKSDTEKTRRLYTAQPKNGKWVFDGVFEFADHEEFHTGSATISGDGRRLYVSLCRRSAEGNMHCDLYLAEKKAGRWKEAIKLPEEVNSRKYSSMMPAVTTDPVKGYDVLYFVSNRKKGKGKNDIWYTVYNTKKKTFKAAKSAGNKINSPLDEITPFYDAETSQLYFSSESHGSLGGFDVFSARGQGSRWSHVQNIGAAVNTGADELYYSISPARKGGFFVSNRKGGNAYRNSTCCDDIYQYKVPDYRRIKIEGTVADVIDQTSQLSDATVDVYLVDTTTKKRSFIRAERTDTEGRFSTMLEPDQNYELVIRKNNYLGVPEKISTHGVDSLVVSTVKLMKKPKGSIVIPDFHYEFDSHTLSARQKKIADSLLLTLLEANPELILEIQSHTDSKGTDSYNKRLSQRRADYLVQYLISKNIGSSRLRPAGYGESKPVAPNKNADGSDNPDGRALNRRTEILIIGTLNMGAPKSELD